MVFQVAAKRLWTLSFRLAASPPSDSNFLVALTLLIRRLPPIPIIELESFSCIVAGGQREAEKRVIAVGGVNHCVVVVARMIQKGSFGRDLLLSGDQNGGGYDGAGTGAARTKSESLVRMQEEW